MKKILLLLLMICTLASCDDSPMLTVQMTTEKTDVKSDGCRILELTVRDKTHEYLLYANTTYDDSRCGSGMVHLPECRYCKEIK